MSDDVQCRACGKRWDPSTYSHVCPVMSSSIVDAIRTEFERVYARIAQLEQDADPRTAPGVVRQPMHALAIGTRVRIDDKTHPCHDEIGEVYEANAASIGVRVDGRADRYRLTRSQLALLDDAPDIEHPPCSACQGTGRGCADCKGTGEYVGFTGRGTCKTCGGARCEPCGGSGV